MKKEEILSEIWDNEDELPEDKRLSRDCSFFIMISMSLKIYISPIFLYSGKNRDVHGYFISTRFYS